MKRGAKLARVTFVTGPAYFAVVGIAATQGEPDIWFAYWWNTLLLGVTAVTGIGGVILLVTEKIRNAVAQRNSKFETAVNNAFERGRASANHAASIAVPGHYSYPRGDLIMNLLDRSLTFRWKNGELAAKAIPEGQGYCVDDDKGNKIGYAKDRDGIVALIDKRLPEVP